MKGIMPFWLPLLILTVALGSIVSADDAASTTAVPPSQDAVAEETVPPPESQAIGTETEASQMPSLTESVLPSLTRIGLSLCVIVAIIYLTIFLLKKLSGNRIGGKKGTAIQVVETTYLAPKKSVCLLKLADRAVLVGITDNNINLLTELEWDSLPQETAENDVQDIRGHGNEAENAEITPYGGPLCVLYHDYSSEY